MTDLELKELVEAFDLLTDEERRELFRFYCKYCGTPTNRPPYHCNCNCMRDD